MNAHDDAVSAAMQARDQYSDVFSSSLVAQARVVELEKALTEMTLQALKAVEKERSACCEIAADGGHWSQIAVDIAARGGK